MNDFKIEQLNPQAARAKCQSGQAVLLDVRTDVEFAEGHVPESSHLPLDELPGRLAELDKEGRYLMMCGSGKRAQKAAKILKENGIEKVSVVSGGLEEWRSCDLPVTTGKGAGLSLMRQVQLTIGLLVLAGSLLAIFVDPLFAILPAFLGAGLTVAGSTGWCGLALLLARMPWNRQQATSCELA
jgi:rhodanese-related sulfurtransferase